MIDLSKKLAALLALMYGLVLFASGAVAQDEALEGDQAETSEEEDYCNPNLHDCGW